VANEQPAELIATNTADAAYLKGLICLLSPVFLLP
jgi:hypothetical protein